MADGLDRRNGSDVSADWRGQEAESRWHAAAALAQPARHTV